MLPNQFLVSVVDTASAVAFYSELFGVQAQVHSHRYATFELPGGMVLALWSGNQAEARGTKGFELGFLTPDGDDGVRRIHREWSALGVEMVEDLHEDVFGHTFVATDLDGNRLRVAPMDN